MKLIPRLVFWLGVISIVYGIILKLIVRVGTGVSPPLGVWPQACLQFSILCFVAVISFSVVFIFQKKAE